MKNNCGVIAYDLLVGQLNGRTNNISLDTLAKMAQDNGFILFPMKITKSRISELSFPFIVHHNHHFETWEDETAVDLSDIPHDFYVLASQCIPELVVTEEEARGVKGGGPTGNQGKKGAWYQPFGNNFLGAGPTGGKIFDAAASFIPGVGPLIAAGSGAAQGYFGSQKDNQSSGTLGGTLLGAAEGYGAGALGHGLVGGLQAAGSGGSFLPGATTAFGNYGINPQIGGALNSMFGGQAAGTGYATNAGNIASSMGLGLGTGTGAGSAAASGGGGLASSLIGGGARLAGGSALSNLLGPGLLGASTLPQNPQFNMPASVDQYKNTVKSGAATPLGADANTELSRIIKAPFGTTFPDATSDPYIKAISDQFDTQMARDMETLKAQFATTGSPYSGELGKAQEQLIEQYSQAKQTAITQMQSQLASQEVSTKLTALSQASGIDQSIMQDLAGITQLDVNTAALQYGVDSQTVQQLRQLLGTAGSVAMAGNMGLLSPAKATV